MDAGLIKSKYGQLLAYGIDAATGLRLLQDDLASLESGAREKLLRELQNWHRAEPTPRPAAPDAKARAPRNATATMNMNAITPGSDDAEGHETPEASAEMPPCGRCGTPNAPDASYCSNCGYALKDSASRPQTRQLGDKPPVTTGDEYFEARSFLVFGVRGATHLFAVRPQDIGGEVILGRESGNPIVLSVDTPALPASELGVSRLHASVRYHSGRSRLTVQDLGSTNGTFVNERRLYEEETRVLCDGDLLRLGRLELEVHFFHLPSLDRQLREARASGEGSPDMDRRAWLQLDHDLREALASMLASVQLLKHYEPRLPAERRDECLREIEQQIHAITRLLDGDDDRPPRRR